MLSYCLYENKTTRTNVLMDFIRRIEANASMYYNLKKNEDYSFLASKLYAYYKKYSQYEHYSQMGNGDSLVPFDEDAPLMAKAYEYITISTATIVENMEGPTEVMGIMGRAKDEVEEILNSNS